MLLWVGAHAWTPEVADLKAHLDRLSIPYSPITSLVGVNYSDYAAIIMGGGKAKSRLDTISQVEEDRLREAVEGGLGYLGHCAGAFMAGTYGTWGLRLSPLAYDYPSFGAILTMSRHEMILEQKQQWILFYGGAELDGHGEVIAEYRNGQASIVQFRYGQGLVILTGGHPEVSQATISALGLSDPDGSDAELESVLIRAAVDSQEVK